MEMKDVVTGRGEKLFKEINASVLIQFCINEQTRWIYLYVLELVYGCVRLYLHTCTYTRYSNINLISFIGAVVDIRILIQAHIHGTRISI
jgi:hypothetical protein